MKGIFQLKPVIPKTTFTWDVKVVLKFLSLLKTENLTLRLLSIKLALLLVLTTGQRCQTLKAMNLKNMVVNNNYIKIRIGDLFKQTKTQKHLGAIYIEAFTQNPSICVVSVKQLYQKDKGH